MRPPDFWYGKGRASYILRGFLGPAAMIYRVMSSMRFRLTSPTRANVPVICIGNLTVGGTGKTPVAIAIADLCAKAGIKPAILLRGYRGRLPGPLVVTAAHNAMEVGDEALMHAARHLTIVSGDRVKGAALAVAQGARIIVMDDGFQNPRLAKDLSLVVIDAETGFGSGEIFPLGPLREPAAQGLTRAQGIILMGDGNAPPEAMASGLPLFRAHLAPENGDAFTGKKVVAFAGIGRPEKFFAALEACGATVVARHSFDDHQLIAQAVIDSLCEEARKQDAVPVTTEKDFFRLAKKPAGIRVLKVNAVFDDQAALLKLITPLLARAKS